ncbi:hypothetical protein [Methylocella sp. CPCC 101449]|uniref:hypothetical protein n=1 Tax=Methylocella sp. CPCC 101449 TaxID=2987531 RepID=UPI00288CBA6B|nr:hypothetical protein [Methylocella sp. CPCC 101449]MDT2024527.1 hypothetical protein [Methylocella sp. CPCC 101449]
MDIIIKSNADGTSWEMSDLLGRSMGQIVRVDQLFRIQPAGHAIETMGILNRATFHSLDKILEAIETHTRGICQIDGDR